MAIPQATVDLIMRRCGRRCCICRRFAPLQLQVHHIVEQRDGGGDDADNLIALCANCHVGVHTTTKLSRAFTDAEMKQHREAVYQAVESGVLVEGVESSIDLLLQPLIEALRTAGSGERTPLSADAITPQALEILALCLSRDHSLGVHETPRGLLMESDNQHLLERGGPANARRAAEFRHALNQLLGLGLMEQMPDEPYTYFITRDGYLFADRLIASGQLILHQGTEER